MNYLDKIRRNLNAQESISFDYDGTISTRQGQALAKRFITKGYKVYIITARPRRDSAPVLAVAKELGISEARCFFTGSNKAKIEAIQIHKITKHYDNNPEVVQELHDLGINAQLVNYGN